MSEFVEVNENEEVVSNEIEETMETMEDALDSVKEIKVGDTVLGDVLAFDDNQIRVSIQESGGLEGVVPRNELSATPVENMEDVVSIGDEIELVVLKPIKDKENGNFLLSKKRVDAKKVWEELQVKFDNEEVIEAPVKSVVKGGLVVDAGVRGFVPASMVEDHFVEDFSPYVGQTLKFVIIEIEPSENRLILSHKEIARKESETKRAELLSSLEVDSIVEGTVARLVNFGAFIDLGGVDGLVHISRIAHEHVDKPSDYLTPGDKVNVKVLSVDEEDGRVSLSIKDTLEGPWDNIEEKAPEGSVLKGTVKRLTSFGAFVEVFPGVEGLVHISQIAHEHIATPHERLEEGQEIDVKVLSVDPEENRLSLSVKALLDKPEGFEEAQAEASNNQPRRENRRQGNKPKQNRQRTFQDTTSSDDSESGFTLADMLGDQLDQFKGE
ncbi:30S ribosomal protein S1 [Aerococcaceae bacterium WGS1372]